MLTGASDLASPFFTPRVFLDGIYITEKCACPDMSDYFRTMCDCQTLLMYIWEAIQK